MCSRYENIVLKSYPIEHVSRLKASRLLTAIRYENHAETIRIRVFTLSIRNGFHAGMKSYPV